MKEEKYKQDLLKVVAQAKDKWDLERMRLALIEMRAEVDNRLYKAKQDEFKSLKTK